MLSKRASQFAVLGVILLLNISFVMGITNDEAINQVMQIDSVTGAADLTAELENLMNELVNDGNNYGGVGYNFTKCIPRILYFRGNVTSVLAMCLPLLPGTIGDAGTLKGKLAARLKTEVTDFLLNQQYWDWEHSMLEDYAYVTPANPRIRLGWSHRERVGPHWEKMHALWAYAYYTGDWTTIETNWDFIKARYNEGYKTADSFQRVCWVSLITSDATNTYIMSYYRNAMNDLANGLIGYVRMAEHMSDSTASQARSEAQSALNEVLNRVDRSWSSCPVTQGWDNQSSNARGEWTPGYNLAPELGRWINDNTTARSQAQNRLNEAATAARLNNHWWCGFFNNTGSGFGDEDGWGVASLSHQLFIGRAWMLEEDAASLRQVRPWHTIMGYPPEYRDMLYIRSLYALISRHATVSWVNAN